MSYSCYYTIRENKKSCCYVQTLFWGKQRVYDYKRYIDEIFDTYKECLDFFNNNNLDYKKFHIRKSVDTSSGCYHKDYIYRRK